MARKVFGSNELTKLVQLLFLGAPNPYVWNEDEIRCAHLRREILAELVEQWFDGELYVARSHGWAWNQAARGYELRAKLVDGRPPNLRHPLRMNEQDQMQTLSTEIMPKLQRLLIALFGFYLPRSFRFGRRLFDDVDTERLADYLEQRGSPRDALAKVEELGFRQGRWKSQPRVERSIGYRLARGDLREDEAAWFRARPFRWYLREGSAVLRRLPGRIARRVEGGLRRLARLPWRSAPSSFVRFFVSQRYRAELARDFTEKRIAAWVERRQMSESDARFLKSHLDQEDSATFATDFGVHLAIKPFVKTVEYWLLPLLYALGLLSEGWLALAMLAAGPAARSLCTGSRIVQNSLRGKERPWTALFIGVIPVLGNFAFPIQLLRSSHKKEDDLARFLLYDGFARIGAGVPIWGGQDTLTEHRANQLADQIVRER